MSPGMSHGTPIRLSFPRVSGDEPEEEARAAGYLPFSPRERG